jgi:formate hydrogenlyase transcriptional activator
MAPPAPDAEELPGIIDALLGELLGQLRRGGEVEVAAGWDRLRAEIHRLAAARAEAERRHTLLASLLRVVGSSLDLRQVFERAAADIRRLTGCDRVGLTVVREDGQTRDGFAVDYRGSRRWLEYPAEPLQDSATQWVLKHRRIRRAGRLDEARPFPEDCVQHATGYLACVYVPLVCRNEGVGALILAARDDRQVDTWDLECIRELSDLLAVAVDSDRARARLDQSDTRAGIDAKLRVEFAAGQPQVEIVGDSKAMQEVRRAIAQVAPTDSTVLILGETGTGKELIARAIHQQSHRAEEALIPVNCAALAPGILNSELFGHEAGAFTGAARRRIGRFERAHQGSIFLDEIAEVPLETQVLLLRVLQERIIERVGGSEAVRVDVRVLAATNRDLAAAVDAGGFRADLFYRLNVFPLRVPPLRERREDIPALIEHFIRLCGRRLGKTMDIGPRTLALALEYPWPGNVRELENLVERAMIVSAGDTLEIDPAWLSGPGSAAPATEPTSLADQERRAILEALQRAGGRIYGPGGAAALLGLKPTTLYGKMRKHQIRRDQHQRP